jgi:hypothetical protein
MFVQKGFNPARAIGEIRTMLVAGAGVLAMGRVYGTRNARAAHVHSAQ